MDGLPGLLTLKEIASNCGSRKISKGLETIVSWWTETEMC
jgi:hypothetical protein